MCYRLSSLHFTATVTIVSVNTEIRTIVSVICVTLGNISMLYYWLTVAYCVNGNNIYTYKVAHDSIFSSNTRTRVYSYIHIYTQTLLSSTCIASQQTLLL